MLTIDVEDGAPEEWTRAMFTLLADETVLIASGPMRTGDADHWNVRIGPKVVTLDPESIDTSLGTPIAIGYFQNESYSATYYLKTDGSVITDESC